MINRKKLVQLHNPVLTSLDTAVEAPLSVGNGELAFTADITGLQTLYEAYTVCPLCTMSQWGWHTRPSEDGSFYTLSDVEITGYDFCGRTVAYPVECKPGNEAIYHWLRENPHRLNLARLRFLYQGKLIQPEQLRETRQELDLYTGVLHSQFSIGSGDVKVITVAGDSDVIGFSIESPLLRAGLSVQLDFPYGSPAIHASDWSHEELHSSCLKEQKTITQQGSTCQQSKIERCLNRDRYCVNIRVQGGELHEVKKHVFCITGNSEKLMITAAFYPEQNLQDEAGAANEAEAANKAEIKNEAKAVNKAETVKNAVDSSEKTSANYFDFTTILGESRERFQHFWEEGAMLSFAGSTDPRAAELERRMVCSLYLTAIQSAGSVPPQETGLTCNSWYGKFHLEMHPLHSAYLALWNRSALLEKSFRWYLKHLPEAEENAARNGYRGARWPKMTGPEAIDSPSIIAPLLIWQQPHILYMLDLVYRSRFLQSEENSSEKSRYLQKYLELVVKTADFMYDYAAVNGKTGMRELNAPLIPAQESHAPEITKNPAFELEYWVFGLMLAADWCERYMKAETEVPKVTEAENLKQRIKNWRLAAEQMAPAPVKDGLLLAHENCPDSYENYNKDHPSMLFAYGFLPGNRLQPEVVKTSCDRVYQTWDFKSMWGWDFALLAMTETRLGRPEKAVDILMKETEKNSYVISGNNAQRSRTDLPLYLPGNGALLLALGMMAENGFPKDGSWQVEKENLMEYPY